MPAGDETLDKTLDKTLDETLNEIIAALERIRDHGPDDLRELVYQLALVIRGERA